jgi:hypothetical protein
VAAAVALIATLPTFTPENLISRTSSRFQTPSDVLFTRLAKLRPGNVLTANDEVLRSRLTSVDGRSLYLAYGPSTIADCPFCKPDDPASYLYYAIPSILLPHLLNLLVLGLATSGAISGKEGRRWRIHATLTGAALAVAELWIFHSYDWKANARTTRAGDITHFYWTMWTARGILVSLIDAGLAGLLWASSTNRVFVIPPSPAERLETVAKTLESNRGKLITVGIVRNVSVRDEPLRKRGEAYWRNEGEVMGEVMSERAVVEGMRNALESGRISVQEIEAEAVKYAEGITLSQEAQG